MRTNTTITVKDDGKVDLSILYAMKDMEQQVMNDNSNQSDGERGL